MNTFLPEKYEYAVLTNKTIEVQLRALHDKVDLLSTNVDTIKERSDKIDAAEKAKIRRRERVQFRLHLTAIIVSAVYWIAHAADLI